MRRDGREVQPLPQKHGRDPRRLTRSLLSLRIDPKAGHLPNDEIMTLRKEAAGPLHDRLLDPVPPNAATIQSRLPPPSLSRSPPQRQESKHKNRRPPHRQPPTTEADNIPSDVEVEEVEAVARI